MAAPSSSLPSELPAELAALPPALRAECEKEWTELLRSQRHAWTREQYADEFPDEPQLRNSEHEVELQRILSSLDEEEARWRAGAAANERRWIEEAEAMFARWRLEDATLLNDQQQHASSEAQRHEMELAELRPARCAGWADLLHASQLGRLGAHRVAQLCAEELRADAALVRASTPHAPAPTATLRVASLRRLLCALHRAGAAALDEEPLFSAISSALTSEDCGPEASQPEACQPEASHTESGAAAGSSSSGGAGDVSGDASGVEVSGDAGGAHFPYLEGAGIPYMGVLLFLLCLVDGASSNERA